MLTLRQVEVFRAVMVAGSVTGAARMLYVSQPAVSRIIADLEEIIGFKLFARRNRQLVPTEESRLFYEEVRKAFLGLDDLSKSAASIRNYKKGQLHLITLPSLAATLMSDLIAAFCAAYPSLSISLEVQSTERISDWISSGQCDLGLTIPPVSNPTVDVKVIAKTEFVCILPKSHPLAEKEIIHANDLSGEKFVSFKSDSMARHLVDEVFTRAGCQRDMHIEARTREAICGMVAAGLGVSVIGPVYDYEHVEYNLITRPFRPAIPIELLLLRPANRPTSRAAELFIGMLSDHVRRLERNMVNSRTVANIDRPSAAPPANRAGVVEARRERRKPPRMGTLRAAAQK